MKVGLGMLTAQRPAGADLTDQQIYQDIIALAVQAEAAGFDSLWLSEHHFVDDGYMPSLLVVAAAIAVRTSAIEIGTGVLLAPLYHPLRLAEDAATVDLLSSGRLLLGIGAGWREEEFAGFGVPRAAVGRRIEQTVAAVRQAWSGEPTSAAGGTAAVRVTPRPFAGRQPPIWIGARSAAGIRRAARIADGFMAARVRPAALAEQVGLLRDELAELGRDPAEMTVSVHAPVFAWPDGGAWDLVRDSYHYVEWKYQDMAAPDGRTQAPPALTPAGERGLRSAALIGTPEEVAELIRQYRDAAGKDLHFVARLYWPGLDRDVQREAIRVFASDVIPAVR